MYPRTFNMHLLRKWVKKDPMHILLSKTCSKIKCASILCSVNTVVN